MGGGTEGKTGEGNYSEQSRQIIYRDCMKIFLSLLRFFPSLLVEGIRIDRSVCLQRKRNRCALLICIKLLKDLILLGLNNLINLFSPQGLGLALILLQE